MNTSELRHQIADNQFKAIFPFVLRGAHGGVLCVDDSGELRCVELRSNPLNLAFTSYYGEQQQNRSPSSELDGPKSQFVNHENWIIQENREGTVSILSGGKYACAERTGRVSFSRDYAREWELFTKVPLHDALKLKTSAINNAVYCPRFPVQHAISKIIHQTFMTSTLPEDISRNVGIIKARNPDFEYKFWSDQDACDMIYETYGLKILEKFFRIDARYGASRADLFRYLCVYKFGGAYLDIKSNTSKPLSSILQPGDQYILSQWDNEIGGKRVGFGKYGELSHIPGGEYEQWHVIAAPGHPFLEHVINRVLDNIDRYDPEKTGVGRRGVLRLSGPIAYTLAVSEVINKYPHRKIIAEKDGLEYRAVPNYKRAFKEHYTEMSHPIVDLSR